MAENTSTIGKKVKALANPLRDEGIGSGDYLEQITYLVFIKMVDEYSKPPYNRPVNIPKSVLGTNLPNFPASLWKHVISIFLKRSAKRKAY